MCARGVAELCSRLGSEAGWLHMHLLFKCCITAIQHANRLPHHAPQAAAAAGGSQLDAVMLRAARFVALVPCNMDGLLSRQRHTGAGSVWCSTRDVLELAAGDPEAHANMLAGFFMQLGQQVGSAAAFVCVGGGGGEGRCALQGKGGHAACLRIRRC